MSILDSNHPFSPFYRVRISTPEQARIYNRFMVAKIVAQLIILALLLALAGWSWQMFVGAAAIAVAWKGGEMYFKSRRQAQRC